MTSNWHVIFLTWVVEKKNLVVFYYWSITQIIPLSSIRQEIWLIGLPCIIIKSTIIKPNWPQFMIFKARLKTSSKSLIWHHFLYRSQIFNQFWLSASLILCSMILTPLYMFLQLFFFTKFYMFSNKKNLLRVWPWNIVFITTWFTLRFNIGSFSCFPR